MGRLVKLVVYLVVLGFAGLAGYAYLGPFFGADFTPPKIEIRTPVILNDG